MFDEDELFGTDETPAERLARWANTEWYVVTITGINADGNLDTVDVQMAGDIEDTLYVWAGHKHWTNAVITNKQYIGKVPPSDKFN